MRIETWSSDKGDEEIHHFIDGENTYLFGFNKKLLGEYAYNAMRGYVEMILAMKAAGLEGKDLKVEP